MRSVAYEKVFIPVQVCVCVSRLGK